MTISNAIAGRDLETLRTAMTGAVFTLAEVTAMTRRGRRGTSPPTNGLPSS